MSRQQQPIANTLAPEQPALGAAIAARLKLLLDKNPKLNSYSVSTQSVYNETTGNNEYAKQDSLSLQLDDGSKLTVTITPGL